MRSYDCVCLYFCQRISSQRPHEPRSPDQLTKQATSLYQQNHQRPCHGKHATLNMDCVMDGVSLAQTNLTGYAKEEAPHLQIRGLHQITLLEMVHEITM